jgi:hypothetical protein
MQLFVDLKICEGCGSLWYRASGETKVYCGPCERKLGSFPSPRMRTQPGGRRKAVAIAGLFKVQAGGVQ